MFPLRACPAKVLGAERFDDALTSRLDAAAASDEWSANITLRLEHRTPSHFVERLPIKTLSKIFLDKCIFTLQRQFFLQNAGHLQKVSHFHILKSDKRGSHRLHISFMSPGSDIRVIADGYPGIARAEPGSGTGFLGATPESKSNTHNCLLNQNIFLTYPRLPARAVGK
ncbi:hypothetical protein [Methyloterricola oryzae]|uniref:hypothetical protein n=1 Tax=Methyloterricola oryzae TaxID=1495050 RepID=UPI0011AEE7A7|nr:hypothetical protein [Methyloterricola oryzae]